MGQDRRHLQRRRTEPLEGPGRALLLRAALQLPVGRLLQQERLRQQGLHRADDMGRIRGPGQADAEGRPGATGLRRQGRLAGPGHVRHHQPAGERLRLPHQAHEARDSVDGQGRYRRIQPVGRDPALRAERLHRAHLAGRREGTGEQAGRDDVPGLEPGRRELRSGESRRPGLLRLPSDQRSARHRLHGRSHRRIHAAEEGQERQRGQRGARVHRRSRRRDHLPQDRQVGRWPGQWAGRAELQRDPEEGRR